MELRTRLRYVAKPDEHAATDGRYQVRSLYFDNYEDKAVREKLMGASRREKFRIRFYNGDASFIRLEKKSKINRLCLKESATLTAGQCEEIASGRHECLKASGDPLQIELYAKMSSQLLRPRAVVDYTREAYMFPAGNVRITIDSDVRTSGNTAGFLNPGLVSIPAANAVVLEIKFDNYLPDVIRDIVQLNSRHETEFSKYVVSRIV